MSIELGEPDAIRKEDNILWLREEIERLTAERDNYKDRWEQTGCTRHFAMEASIRLNEGYRKRITKLEAALKEIIDGDSLNAKFTAKEALK